MRDCSLAQRGPTESRSGDRSYDPTGSGTKPNSHCRTSVPEGDMFGDARLFPRAARSYRVTIKRSSVRPDWVGDQADTHIVGPRFPREICSRMHDCSLAQRGPTESRSRDRPYDPTRSGIRLRMLVWAQCFFTAAGVAFAVFGIDVAVGRRHAGMARVLTYVLFGTYFNIFRNAGMS